MTIYNDDDEHFEQFAVGRMIRCSGPLGSFNDKDAFFQGQETMVKKWPLIRKVRTIRKSWSNQKPEVYVFKVYFFKVYFQKCIFSKCIFFKVYFPKCTFFKVYFFKVYHPKCILHLQMMDLRPTVLTLTLLTLSVIALIPFIALW